MCLAIMHLQEAILFIQPGTQWVDARAAAGALGGRLPGHDPHPLHLAQSAQGTHCHCWREPASVSNMLPQAWMSSGCLMVHAGK